MLDDADAGRLVFAALVAAAGIAAILLFVLYRVLSAAKRERAEAERRRRYLPADQSKYLRGDRPQKSPQPSNQGKVEPHLSWDDDIPEDPPYEPSRPEPSQPEPIDSRRIMPPERRGFGIGALTVGFILGILVGAFVPKVWQSIGSLSLSTYLDQVQSIGGPLPAGDSSTGDGSAEAGLSDNDLAALRSIRQRLPSEVNPGIEMVSVGIVDGFVDVRIKVSRTLSENELKLFLLTAIDRAIHTVCNIQANADLRALTDSGYDVRVTYVDNEDNQIRRDILASPICP